MPELFSLRWPFGRAGQDPDITVPPTIDLPRPGPEGELALKAAATQRQIDETISQLHGDLSPDANLTVERLRTALHASETFGIIVRRIDLPATPARAIHLLYVDGLVDAPAVERSILEPLLLTTRFGEELQSGLDLLGQVERRLMPSRRAERVYALGVAVEAIVSGKCALIMETAPGLLLVDVRKWPARAVERPTSENVIRGPQEAFTEVLLTNTTLLRRRLMTPDLVFEPGQIGRRSRTNIALVYIKGVASEALLAEARRRITYIDVDTVIDSAQLEQLVEDAAAGYFPTMQATERPDKAAAALAEGRMLLLVEGSPFALIAPAVFGDFVRHPEDYYVKWPFGTILRLIRSLGLLITLLLPALYIAIADFHHEMIPPALLQAIAASREQVPFPAALEVLIMEVAFEVIREGALRAPTALGQTIGIVGALILGQAAVEASIVSPILVIIVATTALGSFTIPDYSLNMAIRFARFGMVMLAASLGLFGVAMGLFILSVHAASLKSFGVPYLSPSGPPQPGSPDNVARGPAFALDKRPAFTRPQNEQRQAEGIMDWRHKPEVKSEGEQ